MHPSNGVRPLTLKPEFKIKDLTPYSLCKLPLELQEPG